MSRPVFRPHAFPPDIKPPDWEAQIQQRIYNFVIYRGGNNHIRSLQWTTGAVTHEDSSGFAGTPPAKGDSFAYYTAHDNTHQNVYLGNDGHLWELFWPGVAPVVGWDLTTPSGAPSDGRLHEIWWVPGSGAPARVDLTAAAGAPPAADSPTAFTVEGPNSQHVAYRGTDHHIYEILW